MQTCLLHLARPKCSKYWSTFAAFLRALVVFPVLGAVLEALRAQTGLLHLALPQCSKYAPPALLGSS